MLRRRAIMLLMESRPYEYMLLNVVPYIRFSMYYTSFTGVMYHRAYNLLRPGDILLSDDKWKLTSLLIPGEWSHAALCVSKDGVFEVAEMTHEHFTKSTFFDFCKQATRVAIIRCRDWDENYTIEVINRCISFEHVKYDIKFEYGVKTLYCSELVISSDFKRLLDVSDEDCAGLGIKYVSPTGLWKAKNIGKVFDSKIEKV
jgi:hypothetical protein